MLSKLIGYEFKATRRIFLPAFGAVLILSLLNAIIFALPSNYDHLATSGGIIFVLYLFAMFAICVLSFVYMINRFYKNLLCDEGYLMFTLPARPSQLIWSKCIVSTIWMILTACLCLLSLFLLMTPVLITGNLDFTGAWSQLVAGFSQLTKSYGINLITVPLEILVLGIVFVANFCMHIYACLALGSLANKHRLGWAFGAYIAFAVVLQFLTLGLGLFTNIFPLAEISNLLNGLSGSAQANFSMLALIACEAVFLAVNFIITDYILTKHLNLQ